MTVSESPLRASILETTGFVEHEAATAAHLLAALASGEAFDLTIAPQDEPSQFPRMHVEWQSDGYVVMCFEDEQSVGFYPATERRLGSPEVVIELGGQALEKWPRQLFLPLSVAEKAVSTFVATGKQDSSLAWVANDAFPRETVWEGRLQRLAWESSNRKS